MPRRGDRGTESGDPPSHNNYIKAQIPICNNHLLFSRSFLICFTGNIEETKKGIKKFIKIFLKIV